MPWIREARPETIAYASRCGFGSLGEMERAMNGLVLIGVSALALALTPLAMAQQGGSAPAALPSDRGNAAITLTPDQIRQLQQALNDHGFDAGEVDGVFSARTSAALKQFQSKAGLPPTGVVDEQLLALVGLAPAAQPADQSAGQGGQGR
jgi:peptidoglycan hydrolase-like protein with peptidoglycan-binding domain